MTAILILTGTFITGMILSYVMTVNNDLDDDIAPRLPKIDDVKSKPQKKENKLEKYT